MSFDLSHSSNLSDDLEGKSFGEEFSSEEELSNEIPCKKINYINNYTEYNQLIKCVICLNPSKDPVMCRFCGNVACKDCFLSRIRNNRRCGGCYKSITNNDLVPAPILGKIKNLLLKIKNENEIDKCLIHEEKILFYCIKCAKKYCGKCLCFNSEEAKNHIGHRILDYKDVKKSQYNELINEIESANVANDKIKKNSSVYNNYKLENEIKFEESIFALHAFKNAIFSENDKKNCIINKYMNDLKIAKNEINEIYANIFNNLRKVENLKNSIENFSLEKININLNNKIKRVKEIQKEIENLQNNNKKLEFKNLLFQIAKDKKDINNKQRSIKITSPINIEIKMEDNSYFSIIIPDTYEDTKEKKCFYLFPMLMLKNKLYEFTKNKLKDVNNSMDSGEDKEENIKNRHSPKNYKILINIKELDDGTNIFNFNVYTYSLY